MKYIIKLMRPHHYIKNLLIFFPLFFSGRFYETNLLFLSIITFIVFSLVCSAVYVMNDYMDIERDRQHPTKKNRPLASGHVSKRLAVVLMAMLLAGAAILLILAHVGYKVVACIAIYILMNVIYNFGGKNMPVLDIVLLGAGYPLRVIIGGYAVGIAVSEWLFLTMLCVSFYLALGKRCGELKRFMLTEENDSVRPVLKGYTVAYLEKHMFLSMGLGIVFYSLWTLGKNTYFVWTVPIVLIICMLYNLLLEDTDGDPIETLISSKILIVVVLAYIMIMSLIIYCM